MSAAVSTNNHNALWKYNQYLINDFIEEAFVMQGFKTIFRKSVFILFVTFIFSAVEAQENKRIKDEENLVVTAQKTEENIQDVPISMTVFDEFSIDDIGIEKIEDIAAYTPNLMMFGYGGDGSLSTSIRGVYTDIMSPTVPVGIYVDGIPILNAQSMNELVNNIERIEVLKGPQGTLYGKNTETGVINIITKQPGNELKGKVDLEFGEDNKRQYKFNAEGPIIKDKFFASISGVHYEKDGIMEDSLTGERLDDRKHNSGKLTLRYVPNNNLEVSFINSVTKRDDQAQKASLKTQSKNQVSLDLNSYDKGETLNSALKVKYDFSEKAYLESVTIRREFKDKNAKDWDFSRGPVQFHVNFDDTHTTIAQELRYHRKLNNGRTDLLFGLYGEDYEHKNRVMQSKAMPFNGEIISMETPIKDDYNDRSFGIFTHLTYGFTDAFRILGGIRYDREKKEFEDLLTKKTMDQDFNEVSPKLSLEYDFKANIMGFATIAKGYRGGGFNKALPDGYEDKKTFDEETLISYEAGIKTSFADERLIFNGSFYYMTIDDMQTTNPVGNKEYITNASEAHSLGCEIESFFIIAKGLKIFGGIGYNKTKFDKYIVENQDGSLENFKGNTNPFAPEFNYNVGISYRSMSGFYSRFDITGYGDMYFDKENTVKKDAYNLVLSPL